MLYALFTISKGAVIISTRPLKLLKLIYDHIFQDTFQGSRIEIEYEQVEAVVD